MENKKQMLIIAGAVVAGIFAVLLTSSYVKTSIEGQTRSLAEKFEVRQKQAIAEIQQKNEQQMTALVTAIQNQKAADEAGRAHPTTLDQANQIKSHIQSRDDMRNAMWVGDAVTVGFGLATFAF